MNGAIGKGIRLALHVIIVAALAACGGGGGSGPPPPPATYTVGGTVTGLTGSGLVLTLSDSGLSGPHPVSLAVPASGGFTFSPAVPQGSTYTVSVGTQPSFPAQNCVVSNAIGTVVTANVTSVAVACSTVATYTVGGTVSGLVGSGLTLQLITHSHGHTIVIGPPLQVQANGAFTFDSVYNLSLAQAVEITQQPASPTQWCVIQHALIAGIIAQGENVTDIQVVCSQFSYVANAGDNTVSAYSLDAANGVLTALGTPVGTGTSPHAIVGTKDKQYLFVGNEGSNDLSAFAVNLTSGALTAVPGSPFAAGTEPKALALSGGDSSGPYLYVANAGSDTVSAFTIDGGTGALTPLTPATFATGKGPASMAIDPTGRFMYIANNGGSDDVSAFLIDNTTGLLTPLAGSPFPAGANPLSLALGAAGKFLYTANPDTTNPSISGFSVDPDNGILTRLSGSPFPLPVSNSMAADQTGAYLYVASGANVIGYRIDPTTGALTALPGFPVAAGANAYSVTIDPTNQFLYVVLDGAAGVAGFTLDATTGGLTPMGGAPFPAGNTPQFIAIL